MPNIIKRAFMILLAVFFIASSVSCVQIKTENDVKPSSEGTQASETTDGQKTEADNNTETTAPVQETVFEPFTPIDNDECSVTVKSLDPDSIWGYAVKIGLENKSSDKSYNFSVASASINGVECDPFFYEGVAAGKKSNTEISFSTSDLEENGITEFTDIEITLRVYDSEDWAADDIAKETFHIYPLGKDKATVFKRESASTDEVLVDNDYVTVIITEKTDDDFWGYTLKMYIVNKTDVEITVSADDVSINGYMADPYFAKSVSPGKSAFTSMYWSDSTFEDNEITEVENIEFKLRVYDFYSWDEDDFFNGTITVTP